MTTTSDTTTPIDKARKEIDLHLAILLAHLRGFGDEEHKGGKVNMGQEFHRRLRVLMSYALGFEDTDRKDEQFGVEQEFRDGEDQLPTLVIVDPQRFCRETAIVLARVFEEIRLMTGEPVMTTQTPVVLYGSPAAAGEPRKVIERRLRLLLAHLQGLGDEPHSDGEFGVEQELRDGEDQPATVVVVDPEHFCREAAIMLARPFEDGWL